MVIISVEINPSILYVLQVLLATGKPRLLVGVQNVYNFEINRTPSKHLQLLATNNNEQGNPAKERAKGRVRVEASLAPH
jgi:hypothetical protein